MKPYRFSAFSDEVDPDPTKAFTIMRDLAVEEIQKIILGLKKKGIGILITDHNVRETLSITDRSYLLYDGSVLFSGTKL